MSYNWDTLLCPLCGYDCTHVDAVTVLGNSKGEDGDLAPVTVDKFGNVSDAYDSRLEKSSRRHAIHLIGVCEGCGDRFALMFLQHKGTTFTQAVNLGQSEQSELFDEMA